MLMFKQGVLDTLELVYFSKLRISQHSGRQ